MANILDSRGFWTNEAPQSFYSAHLGTAAGTTTINTIPSIIHAVTVTNRTASGTVILYDSAGTSANVLGTITMGTNTSNDPPPPFILDIQTKNGLTVSNSANIEAIVTYLP